MLFGRRKRIVKRILIVEDEPLIAFDNENMLSDCGYEIVATVDDFERAIEILDPRGGPSDPQRRAAAIPSAPASILPATPKPRACRPCSPPASRIDDAHEVAVGCLLKPYSERQLIKAIECVDRHLQNQTTRRPRACRFSSLRSKAKNDPAGLGRPRSAANHGGDWQAEECTWRRRSG